MNPLSAIYPTNTSHRIMTQLGLTWGDVRQLVEDARYIQPCAGSETRRAFVSERHCVYLEPDIIDGEPGWWVVSLTEISPTVLGDSTSYQQAKARGIPKARGGGVGRRAPTSKTELLRAIVAAGWSYQKTKRHIAVFNPEGKRVSTLPATASDYRSLRNGVGELRRLGLDLTRT